MQTTTNPLVRWPFLVNGVLIMFCSGIMYAWSILKVPLAKELGFLPNELSLAYNLAMITFCLGCFLAGKLLRKYRTRTVFAAPMVLTPLGFILASFIDGHTPIALYLTYGVMCGFGLGMIYNCTVVNTGRWFTDKRGFCNAFLMAGYGLSSLVLGKVADVLIHTDGFGWRKTYFLIGIILFTIYFVSMFTIREPRADIVFPQSKKSAGARMKDGFERRDYTSGEMVKRRSFWALLSYNVIQTIVGITLIGIAHELIMSWGASHETATLFVGLIAVLNACGRVAAGLISDRFPLKTASFISCCLLVIGASFVLAAVTSGSLILGVVGMVVIGSSYGYMANFLGLATAALYGDKYFSTNFSFAVLPLVPSSLISMALTVSLITDGSYTPLVAVLFASSVFTFVARRFFKKP